MFCGEDKRLARPEAGGRRISPEIKTGQRDSPDISYMNPCVLTLFFACGSLWFFVCSWNTSVAYFGRFSSLLTVNNVGLNDQLP